jgi:hypothetical protein
MTNFINAFQRSEDGLWEEAVVDHHESLFSNLVTSNSERYESLYEKAVEPEEF